MTSPSPFRRFVASAVLLLAAATVLVAWRSQASRVLVFSKTAGFRHSSIEPGLAAIRKLGAENGFAVDATEDAGAFTDRNLRQYQAVVFLNTTGDVLDARQQDAFERFIQAGGGWVGIHAATDTEYGWPWYGRLAGAYFTSHPNDPNVRRGTFRVLDKNHPATEGLPDRWEREDEFYNFKSIAPDLRVLVDIDETSYQGGTNGANHPMSWYHTHDGGRAFYTNMGHTDASFTEPLFLRHLLGGLRWAMGTGTLDYARARPEENRFSKVVLADKLNEPVELAVLPGERVLFVERRGAVNLYTPASGRYTRIATIPVSLKYGNGNDAEDGLLGLAADPNFATNGWIYLFYSPEGADAKNVLARYTMRGDSLDLASAKIILEIPVQRAECCHTGGSIAFDAQGNLFVSTGDNTNPFATGYAPIDERAGRSPWDAQKSSANTNDLRGKILRIRPQPDGSYTIPDGNLFPPGDAEDAAGDLHDGSPEPVPHRGRQADGIPVLGRRRSGRIGGFRRARTDGTRRDRAGAQSGELRLAVLRRRQQGVLEDDVHRLRDGAGGSAIRPGASVEHVAEQHRPHGAPAGPEGVHLVPVRPVRGVPALRLTAAGRRWRDRSTIATISGMPRDRFRTYYDGKLLVYEWMRGWIMAVTMNAKWRPRVHGALHAEPQVREPDGHGVRAERRPVHAGIRHALVRSGNDDARLVRIEYNAGNRAPIVAAAVDKPAGAVPLRVMLSSAGTADLDDDSLRYAWTITRANGTVVRRLTTPNPTVTLRRAPASTPRRSS